MPEPSEMMAELARALSQRTSAGTVAWQRSNSGDQYSTRLGDQLITVRSRDGDGNQPFVLALWKPDPDQEGAYIRVEAIDTAVVSGVELPNLVARIWNEARADALDITKSIGAALKALDQDGATTEA